MPWVEPRSWLFKAAGPFTPEKQLIVQQLGLNAVSCHIQSQCEWEPIWLTLGHEGKGVIIILSHLHEMLYSLQFLGPWWEEPNEFIQWEYGEEAGARVPARHFQSSFPEGHALGLTQGPAVPTIWDANCVGHRALVRFVQEQDRCGNFCDSSWEFTSGTSSFGLRQVLGPSSFYKIY